MFIIIVNNNVNIIPNKIVNIIVNRIVNIIVNIIPNIIVNIISFQKLTFKQSSKTIVSAIWANFLFVFQIKNLFSINFASSKNWLILSLA